MTQRPCCSWTSGGTTPASTTARQSGETLGLASAGLSSPCLAMVQQHAEAAGVQAAGQQQLRSCCAGAHPQPPNHPCMPARPPIVLAGRRRASTRTGARGCGGRRGRSPPSSTPCTWGGTGSSWRRPAWWPSRRFRLPPSSAGWSGAAQRWGSRCGVGGEVLAVWRGAGQCVVVWGYCTAVACEARSWEGGVGRKRMLRHGTAISPFTLGPQMKRSTRRSGPTTSMGELYCFPSTNRLQLLSPVAGCVQVKKIHEEEWSYIPVGGPLPAGDQPITAFGAAANLVHPATGEENSAELSATKN